MITEIKDKDGNSQETAETQEYNRKVVNQTEYEEFQSNLTAIRMQIETMEPTASNLVVEDDGGTDILDELAAFLGISVGAAVVVLGAAGVLVLKIYSP